MAFVYSRGNIILKGPNGERCRLKAGIIGPVPEWAVNTPYFEALVKDGKIVVTAGKKDSAIEAEVKTSEVKEKARTKAAIKKANKE